jgi:NAD(P)-dependent dehydrogenase (short-subunit alcohol dehydrogenase family)
LFIKPDPTL